MLSRTTLLLVALCGVPLDAFSCSSRDPRPTDADLFSRATEVFVARVSSTKLAHFSRRLCGVDPEECEYIRADYTLVENIKGHAPRRGHVKDLPFGPGNCSLGVMAGWYYVFYINDEHRLVLHPGGSFALGLYLEPEQLGELRAIGQPPHARPEDEG